MRLFIAVELPESWKTYLAEVQVDLEKKVPDAVRWVRPELMHLTLLFLGDQPPAALAAIHAALGSSAADTAPFRLGSGPLGQFARGSQVAVIWAGIEDDSGGLAPLHSKLVSQLRTTELQFEAPRFRPHLTLGRLREGATQFAPARFNTLARNLPHRRRPASFPVRAIALFRSQLLRSGPLYTVLGSHRLTGKVAAEPELEAR